MPKKILVLRDLLPEQLEDLQEIAPDFEITQTLNEEDFSNVEVVLGWSEQLTPLIENEDSHVKWIQYPFAGVNDLPLKLFEEKGIILTNGSGIHTYAVTETAMGLLLGMTRNIIKATRERERQEWINEENLYELNNKTIMIVGAG